MGFIKNRRSQSSLEFLVASGLVILVITVAVVVTWQTGVLQPASCDRFKIAFSQVMPVDWAVYRNSNILVLGVENQAGYMVNVTDAHAIVGDVTCTSTPNRVVSSGDRIHIILNCSSVSALSDKYVAGDCYRAEVSIGYLNMRTGNGHKSKGNVRGAIEEGVVTTTTSSTTTTPPVGPSISGYPTGNSPGTC